MATAYVNVILVSVGQTQRAKQLYAEILGNDPLNLQVKGSLMLIERPRYRALMEKINMDDASIAELERTINF